jgi:hypothetical protein
LLIAAPTSKKGLNHLNNGSVLPKRETMLSSGEFVFEGFDEFSNTTVISKSNQSRR